MSEYFSLLPTPFRSFPVPPGPADSLHTDIRTWCTRVRGRRIRIKGNISDNRGFASSTAGIVLAVSASFDTRGKDYTRTPLCAFSLCNFPHVKLITLSPVRAPLLHYLRRYKGETRCKRSGSLIDDVALFSLCLPPPPFCGASYAFLIINTRFIKLSTRKRAPSVTSKVVQTQLLRYDSLLKVNAYRDLGSATDKN